MAPAAAGAGGPGGSAPVRCGSFEMPATRMLMGGLIGGHTYMAGSAPSPGGGLEGSPWRPSPLEAFAPAGHGVGDPSALESALSCESDGGTGAQVGSSQGGEHLATGSAEAAPLLMRSVSSSMDAPTWAPPPGWGETPPDQLPGGDLEGLRQPLLLGKAPENGGIQPPGQHKRRQCIEGVIHSFVFGTINAIVTMPVMMSFAAVVYQDPFYKPHMGPLVKHIFLSAAIHQLVMVAKSTLPFAVGQVQDVGLIFLSAMASSIVAHGMDREDERSLILGAALTTLTISTMVVGLLVVITGYLRLASLVQYVPLPVVAGYLGYVGFFVMTAGMFLATDQHRESFESYLSLFSVEDGWNSPLVKLLVAILCAVFFRTVLNRLKHPLALPSALLIVPALFYAVMFSIGANLEDAQKHAWVIGREDQPGPASNLKYFWDIWGLFRISEMSQYVPLIVKQIPTMIPLFFIVAFGSSMDIAAIQQDYPEELDYNRELVTVGLGNIVAAAVGAGYTGSYIFSQTVFCMRNGVQYRVGGLVVVLLELVSFLAPFSPVHYFPCFYLGGLMMWIGFDILLDWLILSFKKVTVIEYVLTCITFATILRFGLAKGLVAGLLLAALLFSFSYARVHISAFGVVPSRGCAVRTFEQRTILGLFSGNMVAASVSGYIFFGSSNLISTKVKEISMDLVSSLRSSMDGSPEGPPMPGVTPINSMHWPDKPSLRGKVRAILASTPKFFLLSFRRVNGVDATAARTFSVLRRTLQNLGVELILTDIRRPQIRKLLKSHGVIEEMDGNTECVRAFDTMEDGIKFCEGVFLEVAVREGMCHASQPSMQLAEVLRSHLSLPKALIPNGIDYEGAAMALMDYMQVHYRVKGTAVFRSGDRSSCLYIVNQGSLRIEVDISPLPEAMTTADQSEDYSSSTIMEYGPGGVVGELDFFLQRPRSFNATCVEDCRLLVLERRAFEKMSVEAPALLSVLLMLVIRCTSLSASNAVEYIERTALEK